MGRKKVFPGSRFNRDWEDFSSIEHFLKLVWVVVTKSSSLLLFCGFLSLIIQLYIFLRSSSTRGMCFWKFHHFMHLLGSCDCKSQIHQLLFPFCAGRKLVSCWFFVSCDKTLLNCWLNCLRLFLPPVCVYLHKFLDLTHSETIIHDSSVELEFLYE